MGSRAKLKVCGDSTRHEHHLIDIFLGAHENKCNSLHIVIHMYET